MRDFYILLQRVLIAQNEYFTNPNQRTETACARLCEEVLSNPLFSSIPDETQTAIMGNAAIASAHKYYSTGSIDDLNRAISLAEECAKKSSHNAVNLPTFLNNLGSYLVERFRTVGNEEDIARAINHLTRLIEVTPRDSTDLPMYYNTLGAAWISSFEFITGEGEDLDKALHAFSQSVEHTTEDSYGLPDRLSNMAGALLSRYKLHNDSNDVEQAIKNLETAVTLTEDTDSRLPKYTLNLGIGLIHKFHYTGVIGTLDGAINAFKKTRTLLPEGSPFIANCLNELGTGLLDRFLCRGELKDIENAIIHFDKACESVEDSSPNLPRYLYNLSNALNYYSEHIPRTHYIERAIEASTKAVKCTARKSPELCRYYSSLARAILQRFNRSENMEDINQAIGIFEKAIAVAPPESNDVPELLNCLGTTFKYLHDCTGEPKYLKQALKRLKEAVARTPDTSTVFPRHLNNLGTALSRLHGITGDIEVLNEGIDAFRRASRRGLELDVRAAFAAARNWISWSFDRESWSEVADAYECAYDAIDRLIRTQILRDDKEVMLLWSQGLTAKVAYALAKMNRLNEAVDALEKGLARLLGESLQLDRANLEQLKQSEHAHLVNDYRNTLDELYFCKQHAHQGYESFEKLQMTRNELGSIISSIRQVQGYASFLDAPGFVDVKAAADDRTIVYLLTTQPGGLALVIRNDVTPVWLPDFAAPGFHENVLGSDERGGYLNAYTLWRSDTNEDNYKHWLAELGNTTRWLGHTVLRLLVEVIEPHEKIGLIPVGQVALLPLHAAWIEEKSAMNGKQYALDLWEISYAPNAGSFIKARETASRVVHHNVLCIDEPLPVKATALQYSNFESEGVSSNFESSHIIRNEAATSSAVLESLNDYSVVHFSCHGHANLLEPLTSGLLMANDELLTVKGLLDIKPDGIRIASLSACETGIPGTRLPDEVINIPLSLIQAGTAGIVSSLWAVSEVSTLVLMLRFYNNCNWRGRLENPVEAFRKAQIWVRDSTREQKIDFVSEIAQRTGRCDDEIKRVYREIDSIDFADLYHWAAFIFTGM